MLPRHPRAIPPSTRQRQRVPSCWLMTDVRLGKAIPAIIAEMPPRSAVVVRAYAMQTDGRTLMIRKLRYVARAKRHLLLLAGKGPEVGYDGRHGLRGTIANRRRIGFFSLPVHDRRELARARRLGADAVLISPVWPTRSHPNSPILGPRGFARLSAAIPGKAIALGGMHMKRFKRLRIHGAMGWAAIDAWLPDKPQR